MNNTIIKHIKNSLITLSVLIVSFGLSLVLQEVLTVDEHVTTLFAFGAFLTALLTDGYIYGIISALASAFLINFAFAFPYFSFDFTIPENAISALVMVTIALITSTLTTKLKEIEKIKADGEREKMRANLLRAVSHDLRTPLTTIYGSSSLILENREIESEQRQEILRGIKEDSEWLIRMVENLLSITRVDGGTVSIIKSPTVLDELIDSVVLKFKKRYPGEQLTLNLPNELLVIPMDALLIEQVILNILENSVLHATGRSKIELKVSSSHGKAIFELSDDGCGIDEDRLPRIFSGYYEDESRPRDSRGRNAGIGLSVSAAIVSAHGGEITAKTLREGGIMFRFALDTEVEEIGE